MKGSTEYWISITLIIFTGGLIVILWGGITLQSMTVVEYHYDDYWMEPGDSVAIRIPVEDGKRDLDIRVKIETPLSMDLYLVAVQNGTGPPEDISSVPEPLRHAVIEGWEAFEWSLTEEELEDHDLYFIVDNTDEGEVPPTAHNVEILDRSAFFNNIHAVYSPKFWAWLLSIVLTIWGTWYLNRNLIAYFKSRGEWE